jgi:serine/threonine-protein kinase
MEGSASEQDDAPVRPGDVLAGKYRVERVLGIGGMGVVVAAHHLQLDERVALKFLLPAALNNAEAVERFRREARAAVRIKSEHVARISDVGELENGAPFMVMEYLEGTDLSGWVHDRGALPIEQAVEFVLQACEAIADAHAIGIVHRDLKPANLFCIRRTDGLLSIKVLDFGISKLTGLGSSAPSMGMTKTAAIMGSPLYMSPEQLQSPKTVDGRTDIWSLGVVLFELVTARTPFEGETLPELVLNIATKPAPSVRSLRPDLPDPLALVLARSLEKDRDRRFQNVAELAAALAPFAPGARHSVERISRVIHGVGAVASVLPAPSQPGAEASTSLGTVGGWGQTAPGPGASRRAALIGVGAAVALMAIGGLFVRFKLWGQPPGITSVESPGSVSAVSSSAPVDPPALLAPAPPPAPVPSASPPAVPVESLPTAAGGASPLPPPTGATRTPEASVSSVSVAPRSQKGVGTAAARAPAPPAPPVVPSCDPPYYYNARHDRVFKPECP